MKQKKIQGSYIFILAVGVLIINNNNLLYPKVVIKDIRATFIFAIIIIGSIVSCNKQEEFKSNVENQKYEWQEELQHGLTWANKQLLHRDDELRHLQMVGYKLMGRIRNQRQLEKMKERVLAQVSELKGMPATVFNYIQSRIEDPKILKNKLDKRLKVGQRIVKIKWSFKDTTFITTAFADDSKGIIYDNVAINFTFSGTNPPK